MNPMNGSVGWADVGILTPYRFWRKYGDRRILEDNYDNMLRYKQSIAAITPLTKELKILGEYEEGRSCI